MSAEVVLELTERQRDTYLHLGILFEQIGNFERLHSSGFHHESSAHRKLLTNPDIERLHEMRNRLVHGFWEVGENGDIVNGHDKRNDREFSYTFDEIRILTSDLLKAVRPVVANVQLGLTIDLKKKRVAVTEDYGSMEILPASRGKGAKRKRRQPTEKLEDGSELIIADCPRCGPARPQWQRGTSGAEIDRFCLHCATVLSPLGGEGQSDGS